MRKLSFGQFVNNIGMNTGFDVGWMRVGRPNSYYVSCPPKKRNIFNPEAMPVNKKTAIHSNVSRKTFERVKTESSSFSREKYIQQPNHTLTKNVVSKATTCSNNFNSASRMVKRRKSSGLDFRPWSGVTREDLVDFIANKSRENN